MLYIISTGKEFKMGEKFYFTEDGKEYVVEIVEDLGEDAFIKSVYNVTTSKGRKMTHKKVSKKLLRPLINAAIKE